MMYRISVIIVKLSWRNLCEFNMTREIIRLRRYFYENIWKKSNFFIFTFEECFLMRITHLTYFSIYCMLFQIARCSLIINEIQMAN